MREKKHTKNTGLLIRRVHLVDLLLRARINSEYFHSGLENIAMTGGKIMADLSIAKHLRRNAHIRTYTRLYEDINARTVQRNSTYANKRVQTAAYFAVTLILSSLDLSANI